MANFRRAARRAIYDRLADPSTGFNARLAAVAGDYAIENVPVIEFQEGSGTVFEGFLVPSDATSISEIAQRFGGERLALVLYTSQAVDQRETKMAKFSGPVLVNMDFYWMALNGAELGQTENVADALEDAVFECLRAPAVSWPDRIGLGAMECTRDPVSLEGDGYIQRIPMVAELSVTVF